MPSPILNLRRFCGAAFLLCSVWLGAVTCPAQQDSNPNGAPFLNPPVLSVVGGGIISTNPIFRDKSAPGSYLIFTNRALYIPSSQTQTSSPSLYLVVTNTGQLQSIGFLDGATLGGPQNADYAGFSWFPNHTPPYMELTIDSPRSMAIGWNENDQPGSAGSPYRILQLGIGTHLQSAQLHGSLPSSGLGLNGNPNLGYSVPLIFDVESKSNGVILFQQLTWFGHAVDTNGGARLSLYNVNVSDPPRTTDNNNFNFTNLSTSIPVVEIFTASTNSKPNNRLEVNGRVVCNTGGTSDGIGRPGTYYSALAIADFKPGDLSTNNWSPGATKIANWLQLNGYDYGWGLDPVSVPGGGRAARWGMGQFGYSEWFISAASTLGGAPDHYNIYFDTAANIMRVNGTFTATNMALVTLTNATLPVSTTVIKAWVNITNAADGSIWKMPLYQ